jgi:sulfhydrogenase subunit beta (sulfur reductase)
MTKIIKKKNIPYLINELKKQYKVYAPIKKGREYVFDSIGDTDYSELALEYPTTILPPKKFFFPQKETLFEFEGKNTKVPRLDEKTVLFGLHLYDIHGLLILDTLFSHPEEDYYYLSRRKNTIVIGLNTPSRSPSFQEALGLDVHTGYDIFLNDIGDAFLATSETKEGDKLLKLPLFEESEWREGITQKYPQELFSNIPRLKKAVSQRKSKVWDDLAKRCFGCGICSYVCPVCYCFETEDQINFDLHSGCRQRRWDACFLPDFSSLSGGHNIRPNLKDRIYHWYYHKFVQMPDEIGKIGCVGCGRCIYYCPAKINYRDELKKLIKENA